MRHKRHDGFDAVEREGSDPQERHWLQRIAGEPDNPAVRLAYADWLETRDKVRGAFIRMDERYKQLPKEDPDRLSLKRRMLNFLDFGQIVPLEANCIEPPEDDELELAVARLGLPLPRRRDHWASPELARLTCKPFDFTNSIGMRFNLLPAGQFIMGNDENADDLRHRVRITKPFHLGRYPVTQEEYERVAGCNPSYFVGDGATGPDTARFPVERVRWNDAVAYCENLESSEPYLLPTEAQWEYACRAGSNGRYCFGDDRDQLDGYAVFGRNPGCPEEVGSKLANAWGLFDMHGNVWEWCQDWWLAYETGELQRDPCPSCEGTYRVFRGGAWHSWDCDSAMRYGELPAYRSGDLGFRVARRLAIR